MAELTGRKSRMVRGKDGAIRFLSRAAGDVPIDQVLRNTHPPIVHIALQQTVPVHKLQAAAVLTDLQRTGNRSCTAVLSRS